MDIPLAKSIYERAKNIKKNKFTTNMERVLEDYIAFQKNNPNLPTIAPFCKLDYHGPLFKLLSRHGEDKIDTIIGALNILLHNQIKPKDWAEEHGVKVDVVMKLLRDARVPVRTHMSKIDIIEFAKIEAMAAEEKRKQDARNQNMKLKTFFTNTENSAATPIYTIPNTQGKSNNTINDSSNTNIESNNSKKATEGSDNKSKKLDIKGIIAIILAALAIPFSGFAVKSCGENKGNINQANKSMSVQDNSSNQSSLKIISGDNSNININVGEKSSSIPTNSETTENNINTKDTLHKVSEMINDANKDLNRENLTDAFIINQQYLITAKNIFKLANSIIPNKEKSSGLLEGLINRYNAFAKKAKLDLVKEYDSVYDRDYAMDRIAAPGIAKLNEIILNLRTYIDIAELEMKKNKRTQGKK